MKIALLGHGAMGAAVEALALKGNHAVPVVITEAQAYLPAEQMAETLRIADVAIDFTSAAAVRRNVEACLLAGIPLVEGTTGWGEDLETVRETVAARGGTLVHGANFSIGVNLFYRIADFAAALFSRFPEYEPFIEEQHHSRKKDAPSGTALRLKEIVARRIEREFTVAATRAGNIPGTHRLGFDGLADQVILQHSARSREGFAAGALIAAEWIKGKTGIYEFGDVMEDILSSQ